MIRDLLVVNRDKTNRDSRQKDHAWWFFSLLRMALSDRSFERQPRANMYSLALFFLRKSMVGPPWPRFCCLQYYVISYVRSCYTTACCRRVVFLLHTTPYEMLRLLLAAPLPAATTSASAQLLLLLLLLLLLSSVSSYITNQSRPATNSLLWDISGILPKQWTYVSGTCVHVCT